MMIETEVDDVTSKQAQKILSFDADLVAAKPKDLMNKLSAMDAGVKMVLIEDIHVLPDFNVRIRNVELDAHIEQLAQSMLVNGFLPSATLAGYGATVKGKPILYVTDGHNRLAAAKRANQLGASIEALPMAIAKSAVSMEDLTVAMMTTATGKKLSTLEQGLACKRLAGYGWDSKKIAHHVQMSVAYVERLLSIAGSPLSIRTMISSGEVPMHVAEKVLRENGANAVSILKEKVSVAKAAGKSKITLASVGPKPLPKKLVTSLEQCVMNIYEDVENLSYESKKIFTKAAAEDDQNATISLPACTIWKLMGLCKRIKELHSE